MTDYFSRIERDFNVAFEAARAARLKGVDPSPLVEIAPAADVAARVEGLVGPPGVADRIRQLTAKKSREPASFEIAKEILEGRFSDSPKPLEETTAAEKAKRIEQAIRTGLALFTEGVVSAPIEGVSKSEVRKNPDGSEYLAVFFAGPIRGAGGTGQAFVLLLADFCRQMAKISNYRPLDVEVDRYVEECMLYARKTRVGQYMITEDEIRHIIRSCPVCLDGDSTEKYEVQKYKNLASVPTNKVRGGMCLVMSEGICLKAAKVMKIAKKAGLDWSWLSPLVKIVKAEAKGVDIKPISKYMDEIVAGRPIFSYPLRPGGFRLRYGRTPYSGIAAKAIHPATMTVLEDFPVVGTQVKIERPGKGCIVTPCEEIDGPLVKLSSGSVVRLNSRQAALDVRGEVSEIVFLGDLLVNYGDFLKSNHPLVPSGYVEEWYQQDLLEAGVEKTLEDVRLLSIQEALSLSREKHVPLHPRFTYCWHDIETPTLKSLAQWVAGGKLVLDWFEPEGILLDPSEEKRILELLGVPHQATGEGILIEKEDALALLASLGLLVGNKLSLEDFNAIYDEGLDPLTLVNKLAGFPIRRKVGTYVGSSMGRPEKAKPRKMKPPVHSLFPIGWNGGKIRSLVKAASGDEHTGASKIEVELGHRMCGACGLTTWKNNCPSCHSPTLAVRRCLKCGAYFPIAQDACSCGGMGMLADSQAIDLHAEYLRASGAVEFRPIDVKAVVGLISDAKTPEPMEKGILRSKHEVFVFRDGTMRFDATEVPATHFTPKDAHVTVEQLHALGYSLDMNGEHLARDDQWVELRPQDLVLAEDSADYLLRVCHFVDDELVYLYRQEPLYRAVDRHALLGQLVVCLAPHTSAGIVGRIIGFSPVRGIIAHPFLHCATRRNCLSADSMVYYENDDALHAEGIEEMFDKYEATIGSVTKGSYEEIDLTGRVSTFGSDLNGNFQKKGARKLYRRRYEGKLLKIVCGNNQEIKVTPEHRLWIVDNGTLVEKSADELEVGDTLASLSKAGRRLTRKCNDVRIAKIKSVEPIDYSGYVYDLELDGTSDRIYACGKGMLLSHNCDGDELAVMMLGDALLNFSRAYLPASRGGHMDAPLVLTVRLDPTEIDDEAHAMDVCSTYPKSFYEATLTAPNPSEVKLETVSDRLNTPAQFEGIKFTHPAHLTGAPVSTSYITSGSMMEKLEKELALMSRIRAVDAKGAAERIILSHFFPDLYGNLRSFSKQSFRCVDCNAKWRRAPLRGKCVKCGGKLLLTINRGGIEKYLAISQELVKRYGLPHYLEQRLMLISREITSVFEDEAAKQFSLADYV